MLLFRDFLTAIDTQVVSFSPIFNRFLYRLTVFWLQTRSIPNVDYFRKKEEGRQWKCSTIFIIAVWPIIICFNAMTSFFSFDLTSLHQYDIQRNSHITLPWAAPPISLYSNNHQCLLLRVVRRIIFPPGELKNRSDQMLLFLLSRHLLVIFAFTTLGA